MKRYISVSLPYWATERWRRRFDSARHQSDRPLVLTAPGQGGLRITAVDARAAAEGLHPGQRLADARASVPLLDAGDADPVADAAALGRLADWCGRYTPWTAVDGGDGLILDVSGCAHLFGGETALLADLTARLVQSGITARAAAADTPAAAWAWARFGDAGVLETAGSREKLASLPVEALRLPPATVDSLRRLGLRRIGDIAALPRAPLAARLGAQVLTRLDRLFGVESEAISPRRAAAVWRARIAFADGISRREDLDAATRHLLQELSRALAADGRGVRRLELALYRLDGTVQFLGIGTSRPTRDVAHLMRLFGEPLGTVEPGFGIETMILGAVATDPLEAEQMALADGGRRAIEDLAPVVDRLQGRLGRNAVVRLVPVDSHCPERAVTVTGVLDDRDGRTWPAGMVRPVQLLAAPEMIDVGPVAVDAADAPPASFRWRRSEHRVAAAEGPERIAPEWWRPPVDGKGADPATRDYYWLQDTEGRRYWVYRVPGAQPRWYLHGLFA
jgi:protein ImuB